MTARNAIFHFLFHTTREWQEIKNENYFFYMRGKAPVNCRRVVDVIFIFSVEWRRIKTR